MQKISPPLERLRWRLTVSFWIVLGGAVLYLVASFLPFTLQYIAKGLDAPPSLISLWEDAFRFGEIVNFWAFAGLLSMGLVFLLLAIQLFARRTMKALMAITLPLSFVSLPNLFVWVRAYYRLHPQMRLAIEFGMGFYLIIMAVLITFVGSIIGLAEKRKMT